MILGLLNKGHPKKKWNSSSFITICSVAKSMLSALVMQREPDIAAVSSKLYFILSSEVTTRSHVPSFFYSITSVSLVLFLTVQSSLQVCIT